MQEATTPIQLPTFPLLKIDENSPRYHRTKTKGDIAEAMAALAFVLADYEVCKPTSEKCPYDLVVDDGERFAKVQVKWARVEEGCVTFRTSSVYDAEDRCYSSKDCDFFAGYAGELNRLFVVPHAEVGTQKRVQLRLTTPLNGQAIRIRWASDYEFTGVLPWPT